MKVEKTDRGFEIIKFEDGNGEKCSLQQSSAFRDDEGADKPGSSLLWLGRDDVKPQRLVFSEGWVNVALPDGAKCFGRMHLTRPQVQELVGHLQKWCETGSLG